MAVATVDVVTAYEVTVVVCDRARFWLPWVHCLTFVAVTVVVTGFETVLVTVAEAGAVTVLS